MRSFFRSWSDFRITVANNVESIPRCLDALLREARRRPHELGVVTVRAIATDRRKKIQSADEPEAERVIFMGTLFDFSRIEDAPYSSNYRPHLTQEIRPQHYLRRLSVECSPNMGLYDVRVGNLSLIATAGGAVQKCEVDEPIEVGNLISLSGFPLRSPHGGR